MCVALCERRGSGSRLRQTRVQPPHKPATPSKQRQRTKGVQQTHTECRYLWHCQQHLRQPTQCSVRLPCTPTCASNAHWQRTSSVTKWQPRFLGFSLTIRCTHVAMVPTELSLDCFRCDQTQISRHSAALICTNFSYREASTSARPGVYLEAAAGFQSFAHAAVRSTVSSMCSTVSLRSS